MAALGKTKAAEALSVSGPPFPDPLEYLWAWFQQISLGIASNGEGYPTITWEGLESWCRQMQVDLDPWETEALMTLSVMRAGVHAENMQARLKKK